MYKWYHWILGRKVGSREETVNKNYEKGIRRTGWIKSVGRTWASIVLDCKGSLREIEIYMVKSVWCV